MHMEERSAGGISLVPIRTHLFDRRKVFITGEINMESANEFAQQILALNMREEDGDKPIDVLINSPGGEIIAGMLMYDAIQGSRAPVRVYCTGMAYSMGAILLACGRERYILPNSEAMIHEPLLGGGVRGSASSIRSVSENLQEVRSKMNRILARHTGRSVEEIEKATAYDHYMKPEECVEFGLCDKIVDFSSLMEG